VRAGILPEGKKDLIDQPRRDGHKIAMESAGITLLSGDLMGIVRARKLARATLRNIKQAQIIALLQRPKGICIAEIVAVTG
jgi:Cu+-exporting ATPase